MLDRFYIICGYILNVLSWGLIPPQVLPIINVIHRDAVYATPALSRNAKWERLISAGGFSLRCSDLVVGRFAFLGGVRGLGNSRSTGPTPM